MEIRNQLGKFLAKEVNVYGKKVLEFLSIRYADAKRFLDPVLKEDYSVSEYANSLKPMCFYQRNIPKFINIFLKHHMMRDEWLVKGQVQSENANVLNIWTSDVNEKKPVLVFIHGGGDSGSGASMIYNGANLASKGIVVVTITYRIGNFGYFPVFDGDKLKCNLAAKDQKTAIEWVRRNIGQFGGDENNITLMGHSGGALSALNQFLNEESNKNFDKLILCAGPLPTARKLDSSARDKFLKVLTDNKIRDFKELANLSPKRFVRLKTKGANDDFIDGDFFKKDPKEILNNLEFSPKKVLVGTNADEFSMIEMPMFYKALGICRDEKKLENSLKDAYGDFAFDFKKEFEKESKSIEDFQIKILENIVFHSVCLKLLKTFSKVTPTYGYRCNFVPNLYNGLRGSYHGAELAFVFDNLDKMNIDISDENKKQIEIIQKDFLDFIKNGEIKGFKRYDKTGEIKIYDKNIEFRPYPHKLLLEKINQTDLNEVVFRKYLSKR